MYPSQSVGMGLHTLTSVRRHYNLADEVWQSFVDQAADPQDDLKLLGSLPASVVAAALAQARLHHSAPLTAVQAAHAGLVFSLTRRILHRWGLGFLDRSYPFCRRNPTCQNTDGGNPDPDRKLKMTNILDQGDDGVFTVEGEDAKARWYQNYLTTLGGWPSEEEEPTIEQLSALNRRIMAQDIAPFTDIAITLPHLAKGWNELRSSVPMCCQQTGMR